MLRIKTRRGSQETNGRREGERERQTERERERERQTERERVYPTLIHNH